MPTEKNPYQSQGRVEEEEELVPENLPASMEFNPEDGSVIVDFSGEEEEVHELVQDDDFYRNLVDELDDDVLEDIASEVIESYNSDVSSRADWEQVFERGLKLLGLKLEEGNDPFEGACTAVHPLLIESAVTFQSKAIQELLPAAGPVKTQILGKETEAKQKQALRVKMYMNYQIMEQMPEYFDETERLLIHLPIFGSGFKKIYYDASLKRPVAEFVPIDQFVVSNFASNLRTADRYTHVLYRSPIQMEKAIESGIYAESDKLQDAPPVPELSIIRTQMNQVMGIAPSNAEYDGQYTLLEQHCYLDIDECGSKPYIVTVDKDSRAVLAVRRNYREDDESCEKKVFFTHYKFAPGFGFYGIGYIHMLGNLTASATAAMRSLLDAGQFATLPAGFRAKGIRVTGDNDPLSPGEFREVEATGLDLTKSIVPLPYKEPSQTLFAMLQFVTTAGQKFADSTEQVINDAANYGPVGTTMALLEASGKFFSAVHKRLHNSQKEELKILARINYESMPDEYPFEMPGAEDTVLSEDFDGRVDIIPVSDPNVPSAAHRMMMAQMALQMSQQAPAGMYDTEELHKTILRAANIPNLEAIIPDKPKPQPMDPVSDILAATKGMPIRAFAGQDHDAHIQVKMAYLQDPENGGNPIMQRIVPILASNIQEHSVMKYQEQINGTTQMLMEGKEQSPQVVQQVMVEAAKQVAEANKARQAGQANTPEEKMVELEAKRLDIEATRIQSQMAKENADSLLREREVALKEKEVALKAYIAGAKSLVDIGEKEKDRRQKAISDAIDVLAELATTNAEINLEKGKTVIQLLGQQIKEREENGKKEK